MNDGTIDTTATAFGDAVRQALSPHQPDYDAPANTELTWSAVHWETVESLGLPDLLLPEDAGGAGASLAEAGAAIEALGALGDPSPAADTVVLRWLCQRIAGETPAGPLALAEPGCCVPWPENVTAVTVEGVADTREHRLSSRCALNSVPQSDPTTGVPEDTSARRALAATRALQIVGAAAAALDMTIGYTRERKQFGRPLARFQAIQQHIAVAAAETAAAAQLARVAFAGLAADDSNAAAAKIAAGRAGTAVAKAAHQFHGAMGYTAEYPLHRLTRAIWQWREDAGNEAWWSRRLGQQVCQNGADQLWPSIAAA